MQDGKNIVIYGGLSESSTYVRKEHFDRILAERDALQLRLNSVEEKNDRLLEAARSLVIQVHATYGNTENHEDCQRELVELEKNS